MAGKLNLKVFYAGMALVAVAGTVVILMATSGGVEAPPVQALDQPFSPDAEPFPGYVMGSDSAPVEIIQYADFACAHCATFTILHGPTIINRLVRTGLARLRFRGLALYQVSLLPHNAAECAGEQGSFWEMHDNLMFRQNEWFNDPDWPTSRKTLRTFRQFARDAGLDLDQYDQCMEEGRYQDRIIATRNEIVDLGIRSTPTFEVGAYRVTGGISYDSLRVLVSKASEQAQ